MTKEFGHERRGVRQKVLLALICSLLLVFQPVFAAPPSLPIGRVSCRGPIQLNGVTVLAKASNRTEEVNEGKLMKATLAPASFASRRRKAAIVIPAGASILAAEVGLRWPIRVTRANPYRPADLPAVDGATRKAAPMTGVSERGNR